MLVYVAVFTGSDIRKAFLYSLTRALHVLIYSVGLHCKLYKKQYTKETSTVGIQACTISFT